MRFGIEQLSLALIRATMYSRCVSVFRDTTRLPTFGLIHVRWCGSNLGRNDPPVAIAVLLRVVLGILSIVTRTRVWNEEGYHPNRVSLVQLGLLIDVVGSVNAGSVTTRCVTCRTRMTLASDVTIQKPVM